MKLTRGDDEYNGTPEDIATLIKLLGGQSPEIQLDPTEDYPIDDFTPVVTEAKSVREEIAKDLNYNPYPGVVPSKEVDESPIQMPVNQYQAENSTGVQIQD